MYIFNVSVCVDELVFYSVYLVLAYHRYTNAHIGPWWVGTQLDIFPTSQQSNRCKIYWKNLKNKIVMIIA